MCSPIRNDPVNDQCLQVIVANGAKIAVVFLEPVEHRLPECHYHAHKPNYRGSRVLHHMRQIQVEDIKSCLYEIHQSYNPNNGDQVSASSDRTTSRHLHWALVNPLFSCRALTPYTCPRKFQVSRSRFTSTDQRRIDAHSQSPGKLHTVSRTNASHPRPSSVALIVAIHQTRTTVLTDIL